MAVGGEADQLRTGVDTEFFHGGGATRFHRLNFLA